MGANTAIEWCHHTFNPWIGCAKVSEACRHCYAETWADRWRVDSNLWGPGSARARTSSSTWRQPRRWNREAVADGGRRRVFCASLADVFEGRRDLDPIRADLWQLIEECPGLDWLLLTKRPEEIRYRVPVRWLMRWPANVWVGTTVEDQAAADKRVPHLLEVPAPVRFLSCEPLLGRVDLQRIARVYDGEVMSHDALDGRWLPRPDGFNAGYTLERIRWVICGGESGTGARPLRPSWVWSLREQCVEAGTPFFFKQWGAWTHDGRRVGKKRAGRLLDGRTWDEVPP